MFIVEKLKCQEIPSSDFKFNSAQLRQFVPVNNTPSLQTLPEC